MTKASRDKGKRGERLFVLFFRLLYRLLGISATREGWKQSGDAGAADVVTSSSVSLQIVIPSIQWEVKNTATLPPKKVRNALMQARSTAKGGPCGLAMRIPGTGSWGFYFESSDWGPEDFGIEPTGDSSQ